MHCAPLILHGEQNKKNKCLAFDSTEMLAELDKLSKMQGKVS